MTGIEIILLGIACGLLLVLGGIFLEWIFKQNGYAKAEVEGTDSKLPNIMYQKQPQYGLDNVGENMQKTATSALVKANNSLGFVYDPQTQKLIEVSQIASPKEVQAAIDEQKPFNNTQKWWNGIEPFFK
jgi:hypothetical protein